MRLTRARLGDRVVDIQIDGGTITSIEPATGGDVDLDGRSILPGLWDNHVHFSQWSLQSQRLDVSAARSAAETAHRIAEALPIPGGPLDEPFVAIGFRDALWPDAPNLKVLDAATWLPVVVVSGDLHSVWLNSAALGLYGYVGHPTGLLSEGDAFRVTQLIDTVSDETLDGWANAATLRAASRGVVGIVDYEMAWNLDAWQRRQRAGTDAVRVEFGVYTEHLDRVIELGLRTGDRLGDLLTMGNFKILIDGSLNTRTAYCYDAYPGGGRGVLTVQPEELVSLLARASAAGIEPSVHAIGDHANTIALEAFETVGCRGRIEHAQLVATSDLPRFATLGVSASVQPDHALDDRDVADRYWQGRTDRAFPLRSLLDAGARLLLGSDAPVSPLDPWVAIAAAVGRTRGGREPWHPEQAVSAAEAIAASTRSRVAVGEPADLVVTELDPDTASADELRAMPVAATLLGGRFTHSTLDHA
jgi:predicted amidohydrolase YtcJ